MPSNVAAWLTVSQATPLEIKPAPYTSPGENEILVKNGAVAINPVDWAIQARGNDMFSWVHYPAILGGDVAGEGSYSRIPFSIPESFKSGEATSSSLSRLLK